MNGVMSFQKYRKMNLVAKIRCEEYREDTSCLINECGNGFYSYENLREVEMMDNMLDVEKAFEMMFE